MKKLLMIAIGVGLVVGLSVREPARAYARVLVAMQEPIPVPEAPEPYPGQRSHGKPPDGWFCYHDTELPPKVDPSHICKCDRKCVVRPGQPGPDVPAPEDPKCTVYCHKDFCRCDMECSVEPEKATAAMNHAH